MATPRDLFQLQFGGESTRGTPVTPTHKFMGADDCKLTPTEESVQIKDLQANLYPAHAAEAVAQEGAATVGGSLSYDEIPYILAALFENVSPTGTGPYTWLYSAPSTSLVTPRSTTLVYGGDSNVWRLRGGLVSELTISSAAKGVSKFASTWVGTRVDDGALASLSSASVSYVVCDHWSLYIDDATGTMGSTAVSSTAFSFELSVQANRNNVFHIGNVSPDDWIDTRWTGSLKLSLQLNATTRAYLTDILGSSPVEKQVRLKAVSGTDEFQIDFAGVVLNASELISEEQNVAMVSIEFTGQYNSTYGNWLAIQVINGVSALS